MTINNIIDQNDQTLACIVVNDYYNAMESSARALTYLQEATSSRMFCSDSEERGTVATESSSPSSIAGESLDECMILLLQADEGLVPPPTVSGSCIYKQGIPITPAVSQDQGIVASILIFNSALIHHLVAESPIIPTTIKTIKKAKRLYELASKADRIVGRSVCFQFAIINNMAVIERKLGNTALSNEYFDYLTSLAEQANNVDDDDAY